MTVYSAGIGRTGTLIAIDALMTQIAALGLNAEIDISRTIAHARRQRSGLVQTEAQYRFVYLAIAHYIDTLTQRLQAEQVSRRPYSLTFHSAKSGYRLVFHHSVPFDF